jgi:outer membrane protein OmpA-like peptidoglycan-associated protein
MVGRFDRGCRRKAKDVLALSQAVLIAGVLTACSTVPDAINPVEWYKGASDLVTGRERPEIASPASAKDAKTAEKSGDQRKDLTKGLVADRGNAQYAEPIRREVAPTKPLARRVPAAAETQVAAANAPVVPPKPVVQASDLPPAAAQVAAAQVAESRVSPDRRTPTARESGPSAPPGTLDMQPPARADIPEHVATPIKGRPKPLQQQYERRLAESAQQVVRPDMVAMPQPASQSVAYGDEAPIHLIAPGSQVNRRGGGGKGLAAPQPVSHPAASFQVASVQFGSGSALNAADRAAIADVARLYRQTGGVVRVVGHAPAPLFNSADAVNHLMGSLDSSIQRANAVARELAKRGVPASKIMVGADPSVAAMGSGGAQVYLDVM